MVNYLQLPRIFILFNENKKRIDLLKHLKKLHVKQLLTLKPRSCVGITSTIAKVLFDFTTKNNYITSWSKYMINRNFTKKSSQNLKPKLNKYSHFQEYEINEMNI